MCDATMKSSMNGSGSGFKKTQMNDDEHRHVFGFQTAERSLTHSVTQNSKLLVGRQLSGLPSRGHGQFSGTVRVRCASGAMSSLHRRLHNQSGRPGAQHRAALFPHSEIHSFIHRTPLRVNNDFPISSPGTKKVPQGSKVQSLTLQGIVTS